MRMILFLGLLLLPAGVASAQAAQEYRFTKAELLASVDDTTAAELRWLLQADCVWNFSGGWMSFAPPRDRTAFARIVCSGNVELLKKIARCEDTVVAVYGLWGLRMIAPEVLVDLLPWLVDHPESAHVVAGDIGFGVSFLEFAADAVRQLSVRADKDLLHSVTGQWLDRLASGHVTGWDWEFGKALVERLTPRGMRKLEYKQPERRELLELARWLPVEEYGPELNPEDEEGLRDRPTLRRTLLYFDGEDLDPDEEEDVAVLCKRLADDPGDIASASTIWALLKMAHALQAEANEGVPTYELLRYFEVFEGVPLAGREELLSRFYEADRDIVRKLLLNPLIDWKPGPVAPDEPEMYRVWWKRTIAGEYEEKWPILDHDLQQHPERLFWSDVEVGGALGGPMPDGSIPKHWLVLAAKDDRRYHLALVDAVKGSMLDDLHALVEADDLAAIKIQETLKGYVSSADIELKWKAREVLYMWVRESQSEEAAIKVAEPAMEEYASDLMANPRVAVYPEEMMTDLSAHEWKIADELGGEDSTATHEELEAIRAARAPWYNLAHKITECNTGFEDRYDLDTLTLEELRGVELTPSAAWKQYAELKRAAEAD